MSRYAGIFIKIIRSMLKNIKMLLLLILVPFIALTLMYLVYDVNNETTVRIGVPDTINSTFIEAVPDYTEAVTYELKPVLETLLDREQLDAFVSLSDNTVNVTYKNEDPSKNTAVRQAVEAGIQAVEDERLQGIITILPEETVVPEIKVETAYLYGNDESTFFDKMFPILTGLTLFFIGLIFSSITLFRERKEGLLDRVLSTSVRRSEIILSYLTGFGAFIVIQTLLLVLYSIYLLDMNIAGSLLWVLTINILLSLSAAAAGILIALISNTEFQVMMLILLITVPQIFLSGLIPFIHIGDWFNGIGYGFPLRYAGDALTEVMIKGNGWPYIWNELLALVLFITGFTVLAILRLKKYRRV